MADTVRHFMEEMVPELEDLEDKGYLTKAEIQDIVRKRKNFEYSLKRRNPLKADYLRYVEYETNLDELIRLRKVAYSIKTKLGKGELGCVKRCHVLYDRATKKFRGDLRLWLNWLEFCKASKSTRQMSKVVTKALQLHPKEPSLWIRAAAWEFEDNKNTTAARRLMQQGLRFCKQSEQMWIEYMRMELVYAEKLRLRQKVLGIAKSEGREEQTTAEERDGAADEPAEKDQDSLSLVIRGDVARVALRNALETLPDSLSLRTGLLQLLGETILPGKDALLADVYTDLQGNFAQSEDAWDLLARKFTNSLASSSAAEDSSALQKTIDAYEAAIDALPTAQMFAHYASFLLQQAGWQVAQQGGSLPPSLSRKSPEGRIALKCLDLYKRAASQGALSEGDALTWPQLALACGKPQAALQAAETGCQLHPQCADLWIQAIIFTAEKAKQQFSQELQGEDGSTGSAVELLVLRAIKSSTGSSMAKLWDCAVQTFREVNKDLQPLLQTFLERISNSGKGPVQGGLGEAAAGVLRRLKEANGVQACRAFYSQLLNAPAAGGAFFHGILDTELGEEAGRLSDAKIEAIFEKAVEAYGKEDTALWLRYAAFDGKRGRGTGRIYWRATKELHDPERFIAKLSASN